MAQKLKSEVRARIVEAAEQVFADKGLPSAKMSDIAELAGISAGNLYRYFPGKEALFDAIVDAEFVARFDALLTRRVRALTHLPVAKRGSDMKPDGAALEMLEFFVAHRRRVVILLDRNGGSPFAGFESRFVERLVELTVAHLRARAGTRPLDALVPFTLTSIFHASRLAIVSILETHAERDDIERAFRAFWSFQLAGLAGFEAWVLE